MKSSKPCGSGRNEDTATKRAGGSRRNTGRPLARIVGCSQGSLRGRKGRSKWSAYCPPTRFVSSGTRKSVRRPIRTILSGNPTSRNGLMCRWLARSKENDGSCTSGKNRGASARSVTKRSPGSQDGIVILCSGDLLVTDRAENRGLLHPTCHQQVHNQGLHVEKPRPVKRAKRKA